MEKILQAFQNIAYIGVLRQRWEEIKKLQVGPQVVAMSKTNGF